MLRLTQFWKDGAPALGVWTEEGVIDASAIAGTMLGAIQGGGAVLDRLAALKGPVLEEARFAPVVTGGDKILCIGRNYKDHGGLSFPGPRRCSTSSAPPWPPTDRRSFCPGSTSGTTMRARWWR